MNNNMNEKMNNNMNEKMNNNMRTMTDIDNPSPVGFKSKYCIACQAKVSNVSSTSTYVGQSGYRNGDDIFDTYHEFCDALMFDSNIEAIEFYNKNKDSFPSFNENMFQWIKVVRVELYDDLHTLWKDK